VQSAVAPIGNPPGRGYLLIVRRAAESDGPLATVCSLLPPFAPVLMAVRMASSNVALWQVGLAAVLTIASIVGLTWLAGRIYANAACTSGRA